jgi:hypothetical protein
MNVIRANCRVQFTAEDIEFILSVLRPKVQSAECLVQLLADEETRDMILDDADLLRAVLEHPSCLRISAHFYFYILVRQVFRRAGLVERALADYVAEVLAQFSRVERAQLRFRGQRRPMHYFFEMLAALQTADDATSFYIRAHIGNYSLFLSGVFPEHIRARAQRRGAPGLHYLEGVGRMNYRVASDHRLARQYELSDIFSTLSDRFPETRQALNDLGDRLLNLGEPGAWVDTLLRSSLKPGA